MHFVGYYGIDTHIYKDEIKLYLYIRILLRDQLIFSFKRLSSTPYTFLRINCPLRPVVFSSLSNMCSVSHCSFLYNTLIIVWRSRNLNSRFISLDMRQSTDVSVPTSFLLCVFITWRIFLQYVVGGLFALPCKRRFAHLRANVSLLHLITYSYVCHFLLITKPNTMIIPYTHH